REQTGEALYHREAVDALCSWLSVLQSNMENLPHDRSRWFASDPESATASEEEPSKGMRGKGKEKDEKGEKGWAATDANGKEKDEKVENNAKGKETGQKGAAVNAGKEGTAGAKGKGNGGQAEDNRQK
ncbi:unnamed protein product, partial [Symbiodinium natans]